MYKHDATDHHHHPVFHQMEGARIWSGDECKARGGITTAIKEEVEGMPKHGNIVEDPNPPFHEKRNRQQVEHMPDEPRAVSAQLKLCLEHVIAEVSKRSV